MAESSPTKNPSETSSVKNLKVKTESMVEPQNKDNFRQCNICFEDTKPDMLVNTPCGHIFCCDCFFEWMKQNYTCPCCRTLLIKREESQLETLRVNRSEIAVQEEHIGELQEDLTNLRRLQKIHKRRIKKLKQSNEEQFERQIRLRKMLSHTRHVRDNVVNEIQDIIPRNKLKRFTTSFYTKLVSGKCENALKEAKNLVQRAALHEWKQRNSMVMNELCEKCKTGRSDAFLDRCLDELLENTVGTKRSNNDIYTSTESETSDNEEKCPEEATTRQQSESRARARRRLRIPSREERMARNRAQEPGVDFTLNARGVGYFTPQIMDISGIRMNVQPAAVGSTRRTQFALGLLNDPHDRITGTVVTSNDEDDTPETPETVASEPEEQIVSEPEEQVVSEPEAQVVSEPEARAIIPIPSFTFTMPDTGEQIEFSWSPPEQTEELFVFGTPENRDDNGDNNDE